MRSRCSIDGCGNIVDARGYCQKHYRRWRAHGDPLHTPPSALDRFHEKYVTDAVTGCMIWTAHRNADGYGQFGVDGKTVSAHRFAYEQFVGAIPDGLVIDHLCRNRACCNPHHLRVCTRRENTLAPGSEAPAAIHAAKTHCPDGHPYNDANTRVYRGKRQCRECRRQDYSASTLTQTTRRTI